MNFAEYQKKVRKERKDNLPIWAMREHALYKLASESGNVLGYHQMVHEGRPLNEPYMKASCENVLIAIAEICDIYGWELEDLAFYSLLEVRKKRKAPASKPKSRHYSKRI